MADSKDVELEQNDSENTSSDFSSESDSEEKRESVRSELKSMSFAELISLKEKLGTKVYNEAMFGEAAPKPKKPTKAELKRENKNRPREATAKKTVPFLGKKKFTRKDEATRSRDPRFDEKCGEYDKKKFKEDYSFMSEIREREIGELKAKLRDKETNGEEKTKIRLLIQRMNNQNLEAKKLKQREAALNDEKKVVQEARKQEKLPFYSTKRERTARDLVKQYIELKEQGKLNKHLEKRRKKVKSRDFKKMKFQ